MEQRTLRVLEFVKIRDQLAQNARSELGQEMCRSLEPTSDYLTACAWQEETEEAAALHRQMGGSPVDSFDDVRPALSRARIGAVLSLKEFLSLAQCMRVARTVRHSLAVEREQTPRLTTLASSLTALRHFEDEIHSAILNENEVSDHASPLLAQIRRQMRACADRVREKLNAMIHSPTTQKYLMEPIITIRGDRYVIPVKQESRQFVPGLIHDQSGSGATLFIEPMAVVEINNDLKELAGKEQSEIHRILSELSARIAPECEVLEENVRILAQIDFLFAKAVLSREMRAVSPKLNDRGFLRLIRARHPLISADTVVPSDLWMGEQFTTLVITGPNTGGKTVTLKTVGLLTLMAQSGLQIPADLGSEMAVFDAVYADIGDEQSIEQSLSTFSSHMTNIVHMLSSLTPNSLALFDELGAGTDPTEGAALAMAILEHLLERRIRTLATTHYSELKAFALTHPGVENASVEFDVRTLRPTYRLSIGVPGKSNAFEIATRLGLSPELITAARQRLSQEQIRFEDVISNAEYHRQVAERERQLAETASAEMTVLRDQADALRRQIEDQKKTLMQRAREDARRVVRQAQEQAEAVIREIRAAESGAARDRAIQQGRRALETQLDSHAEKMDAPKQAQQPLTDVSPGQTVYISHMNLEATVLKKPDAKGEVQVQSGVMKINVPLATLTQPPAAAKKAARSGKAPELRMASAALECDVRGFALDEALPEVDRFLDASVMAGLREVSVIHGKGTGILRNGIQQHLRRQSHVESFREGKFGEGESGVTIIQLK